MRKKRTKLQAVGSLLSITGCMTIGHAANAADLENIRAYSIAPQRLETALIEFSKQADVQVIGASETFTDAVTRGVEGRLSGRAALEQLLRDAPVMFKPVGSHSVKIVPLDRGQSTSNLPRDGVVRIAMTAPASQTRTTTADAAPSTNNASVEEIVVAASRVQRSGYTAPTPTTILGSEDLEKRGATNIAQVLADIPSFKTTTGPQTNGILQRTPGANYSDLRGLGASRTLVLVDGKRFVPQIAIALPGYQVDLNQIPSLMVDRLEVVTGGASAQWGSDAVAGVVNVVLKKDFEGLSTEVQAGQSSRGDNESYRAGLLAGTSFAGGRGHLTFAIDHENNDGVGDVFTRGWGRRGYSLVANPTAGQFPRNFIAPDVQFSQYTLGGLINNTVLRGIQFDTGGVPIPFEYGTHVGTTNMIGGGQPGININTAMAISPGIERTASYVRGEYEFDSGVVAYLEGSYSYSNGGGTATSSKDTALRIRQDNAFLPPTILDAMLANGIDSFNMGRTSFDVGVSRGVVRNWTKRVVAGLQGDIEALGGWHWDAHYTYGRNKYSQNVHGMRIRANYALAYDAVVDPASGQIVCRSTLTNPDNGCVPLNVFGHGSPSQQAIDYVTGVVDAGTLYQQHAAAFNVSGEPFSSWAGPVSVAAGLEWRAEEQDSVVDPIAQASGYEGNNSQPVYGKFNVKEAYVETVVPLASNLAWSDALEFNGAVRHADYSTSAGSQTTWKVGLTNMIGSFLLRATRSQDIRAPNIYELKVGPTRVSTFVSYPPLQPQVFTISSGNPNLQPEVADTTTVGFSWQPDFIAGLQTSVDYYRIKAEDVIGTISGQQIANFCMQGDASYCSLITFNSANVPTAIQTPYLNIASVDISGVDMSVSYRMPLDRLSDRFAGTLMLGFSGNYALSADVDTGNGVVIDRAGELGPSNAYSMARFRGTASVGYQLGGMFTEARVRYVSDGRYDNTWTTGVHVNDNHIPGAAYVDLSASYRLSDRLEIFGVVANLFDRDPPPAPGAVGYPTNPVYFDMIGTTYRIGVRYRR